LKVGDRVLIEAEVCQLSEGGDENYCCVDVQVIAPEQVNKDKVMSPPKFTSLSTRMLTRVGAAVMLVLALTLPSIAQTITTTYPDGRTVKFELPAQPGTAASTPKVVINLPPPAPTTVFLVPVQAARAPGPLERFHKSRAAALAARRSY